MERLFLGLGANLGQRRLALARALAALRARGVELDRVSSVWETEPRGCPPGSPPFLNLVASGPIGPATPAPGPLLHLALAIERHEGRRRGSRNAPRTLDIDILLYGDRVASEGPPILPHPRLHERRFVLAPLAEIAPDLVHPRLRRSVRELLADLRDEGVVRRAGNLGPIRDLRASCGSPDRVL